MGVLEEIEAKLEDAQKRVDIILEDLQSISSIKDTPDSTDATLSELAGKIEGLVSGLQRNVDGLTETTSSVKEAIDTIKQTDPALVVKGQQQIEEDLAELDSKIDRVKKTIIKQSATIESSVKEVFRSVSTKESVIIFLLCANLAISGYLAYSLIR